MSADPRAFAQRVLARFEEVGRHTDDQVKAAGGPSKGTMNKLRKVAEGTATMAEPREPTWTHIDLAGQWRSGSARRVWKGLDPLTPSNLSDDRIDQDLARRRNAVGGDTQDGRFVESTTGERVESGVTNEQLLREILRSRAESDQIRAEVRELSKRVAKLEQPGS